MNKETKFKVGDKAHKTKGYKFPCTIVGVFETINGDIRVVGEMDEYGLLHIFNEEQLEHYNEEQPDLLNDAYMGYYWIMGDKIKLTKDEFIKKCKTDIEFSEKWGLTIEERELNTDERNKWFQINLNGNNPLMKSDWKDYELDQQNIPTKLITISYNDQKIESYE
jgi:hypothetical protein